MNAPPILRQPCPPGACVCEREHLQADPQGDLRILKLTREEEKRLTSRLENLASLDDLRAMQGRMYALLGLVVRIVPSARGVRTVRGIAIELDAQPGLCRKTRAAIPAAIRRGFERNPEIVYALLNERDLLSGA
ncbi:hypothetical protein [Bordetella bronchiseptica]|uniref:hypothetical protein n=1 Tax=Bordetella bronchiseptica TaxID=518 RepID=UPI000528B0C8|nr:hypothetical protein [Bordetella bronchiseptica]